ncbi:MAG: hypothetical protein LBC13_01895, partial [Clostridiales bacterium]|nr:hypothetical protein [Clostridiales bacterium]
DSERAAFSAALAYAPLIIEKLYGIAMQLDKEEITVNTAVKEIDALRKEIVSIKRAFDQNSASGDATALKLRLIAASGALENLSPATSQIHKRYAADIRYYSIFILAEYTALLKGF